ncbi:MAG: glutamate 5-kinase [Nitrospinota bacterium]|jgi:glutamate 5-kinase|nr:glutamate 5-kinase [Nitrospinota bacterium]
MKKAIRDRRGEPSLRSRRIIVKVGGSVLTGAEEKGVNRRVLGRIVSQVAQLRAARREVILVSSGAIAAGVKRLGMKAVPTGIPARQAAAAVGQPILMEAYGRAFKRRGIDMAQVLLTHTDLDVRSRFLNTCNTFETLLSIGAMPVVNENDTVSIEELRFGDNDILAAQVAQMIRAELVVVLSDVEGLYDADPRGPGDARLLSRIEGLPASAVKAAGGSANPLAHGGMAAKINAIKVLNRVGISTLILRGRAPSILARAFEGEEVGTLFVPNGPSLKGKKGWIGTTATPKGWLRLDDGAVRALVERGKSLLPSGVVGAEGDFRFGDLVELRNSEGVALGRGLVNYSAVQVNLIAGKQTREIAGILGSKDYDEIIHRNNLALAE